MKRRGEGAKIRRKMWCIRKLRRRGYRLLRGLLIIVWRGRKLERGL
jgi:hypothetical protein